MSIVNQSLLGEDSLEHIRTLLELLDRKPMETGELNRLAEVLERLTFAEGRLGLHTVHLL